MKAKTSIILVLTVIMCGLLAACGAQPASDMEDVPWYHDLESALPGPSEDWEDHLTDEERAALIEAGITPQFRANQSQSLAVVEWIRDRYSQDDSVPIYPGYLGGYYLDEGGSLVVQIVAARADDAQDFLDALPSWVQIEDAIFSETDLTAKMNWLNARWEQVIEFAVSWGVDTIGNTISIDLVRYSDETIARFRDEIIDSPMISFRDPRAGRDVAAEPLRSVLDIEDYVSMEVIEISESAVVINIINDSNWELITGSDYILEFYDNGVWMNVPGVVDFTSEGLPIFPQDSFEMAKALEAHHFLPMESGLYRIRKTVGIISQPMRHYSENRHDLVAEFVWP